MKKNDVNTSSGTSHNHHDFFQKSGDNTPLSTSESTPASFFASPTTAIIQTKLNVNAATDQHEQEADAVADQVMRMSDNTVAAPTIQRKENSNATTFSAPASVSNTLSTSGQALDHSTREYMEPRFGQDFSQVRVHTDANAAQSANAINAKAYTAGNKIVFGAGQYNPHSSAGKNLMAHELTHVVQQQGGKHKGEKATEIQRRRVPGVPDMLDLVWEENASAHATGLREIVRRAWLDLTPTQQAAVRQRALGGFSPDEARALSQDNRDIFFAHAIRQEVPGLIHGDPSLYQIGARTGSSDAANITTLVNNANTVFDAIAAGTHDTSVGEIFGASNVTTAKANYALARSRMNFLHGRNKVVTDRSGYSAEVGLGGLTNAAQIMISASTMDNPGDNDSVVTMIHESMHAGNPGVVTDRGYIHRADFSRMQESRKLANAAHYEVVPRRILNTANFTFAGQTFTPAGTTTTTGAVTPTLTPREQAVDNASEIFRKAWTIGLNLHTLFVDAFTNTSNWNVDISARFGVAAGTTFANALPFWSKVEKLTVHKKTSIDPASADVSKHPFSMIDIALSEGLVRKLLQAMRQTPQTEADALALETSHATAAEIAAIAGSVSAETELLLKLVLEHKVGQITGSTSRDKRVVKRMGQANNGTFSDILVNRPPSSFP